MWNLHTCIHEKVTFVARVRPPLPFKLAKIFKSSFRPWHEYTLSNFRLNRLWYIRFLTIRFLLAGFYCVFLTFCDIPHENHSFLITNHTPNVRATATAMKTSTFVCIYKHKRTRVHKATISLTFLRFFALKTLATDFSTVNCSSSIQLVTLEQNRIENECPYSSFW